ncbi:hypothetical protein PR003_g21740 [Phytophthora rubi]|uniref:Uncharacterized protein n=1 Tax=Phytophthora rubi TaxID=129364 RepID=A0A6A4D9N0_9STRA|nr:hypothetical protein PR003_g21740 [Phytophthora rubi]
MWKALEVGAACNEPQPGVPTCLRRAAAVGDAGEVDGEDRRSLGVNRQDAGEDRRDAGGPLVAGRSWSGTTRDHRTLRGCVVKAGQLDSDAGWILRL